MKSTPYQANRVLALISVLFNYAMEAEWVTPNPAARWNDTPKTNAPGISPATRSPVSRRRSTTTAISKG